MDIFLLVAALLPAIILMVYVYRKDSVEKEPVYLIVRLFLLGMVAGPLAAIAENIAFAIFESIIPYSLLLIVVEYFIGVAAVEEGFKYLMLNTVRKNREFNYVFDGVVYAVAVALGFAALENVLYVMDGGLGVAVSRAIFAVPGHCADGVVMGVFFGLARQLEMKGDAAKARTYYRLAFLLPVIEHGFYDSALSTESDLLALMGMAVELAFIAFAMYLVRTRSKQDQAIYPNADANATAMAVANGQQAAPQQQGYPRQSYPQPAPQQWAPPQTQPFSQPYAPQQQGYPQQHTPQQQSYPQQQADPTVRYSSHGDGQR